MVTGDALPVARDIARGLGLGAIVRAPDLRAALQEAKERAGDLVAGSDGFAEVFPEDKFLLVKTLQEGGHVVGMTGDGVNDGPALRQAEVGIAVSGATDVAKGAASVVLTTDGLVSIIDLVGIGRATYQRVLTWIINKVSRTILKAGFVVVAFLGTGRFVISALGMVLLVFMTDFVKISLSTDRVSPSKQPESWNIRPLVTVAVVLGLVRLVEALGLLAIGWHRFHLDVSAGQLQTFSFVTLLPRMFERATRTFVSECFSRSPRRSAPYLVLSSRRACRLADSPSCLDASFCTRHISPVTDTITPRQGPPDRWATLLRLDSTYPTPAGERRYHVRGVPDGLGLMYVAGVLSGLLGIGSGAVKVLAMDQAMRFIQSIDDDEQLHDRRDRCGKCWCVSPSRLYRSRTRDAGCAGRSVWLDAGRPGSCIGACASPSRRVHVGDRCTCR